VLIPPIDNSARFANYLIVSKCYSKYILLYNSISNTQTSIVNTHCSMVYSKYIFRYMIFLNTLFYKFIKIVFILLQHSFLKNSNNNEAILELLSESSAEVIFEEKDIDEVVRITLHYPLETGWL